MLTNAELAVLTLVCEVPRYGYEIEQVIVDHGMREWTDIGFSSIYYLLKKLKRRRLLTAQAMKGGRGPARLVYRATPAGRAALRREAIRALASVARPSSPLQLGLANLPALEPAAALEALERHRQALTRRLETLRRRRQAKRPVPYFVEAMFAHGEAMGQAELHWLMHFVEEFKTRTGQAAAPRSGRRPQRRNGDEEA